MELNPLIFFKAIDFFQKEEVNSALIYERANNPGPKVNKHPYRKHLDITKKAELKLYQNVLKEMTFSFNFIF